MGFTLKILNSVSISLIFIGHSCFNDKRVNRVGNELGEFGVEQGDKEQYEVCESSLNNYSLKKFHLGFLGR